MPSSALQSEILARLGQPDVRRSVSSPAARDRQKYVGLFGDEIGLLFRGEHQVAIPLALGSQRGEYRPPTRKSADPMWEPSCAPGRPSAIRRKSAAVISHPPHKQRVSHKTPPNLLDYCQRAPPPANLRAIDPAGLGCAIRVHSPHTAPAVYSSRAPPQRKLAPEHSSGYHLRGTGCHWLDRRPRNRFDPPIFAVSLCLRNLGFIDVPFLLRLTLDVFENSRYLESLATSLVIHVFMFGSLFAGAQLNRARRAGELDDKMNSRACHACLSSPGPCRSLSNGVLVSDHYRSRRVCNRPAYSAFAWFRVDHLRRRQP